MGYEIRITAEYEKWLSKMQGAQRKKIAARISKIKNEEHFGVHKNLGQGLSELKFREGIRIYYAIFYVDQKVVVLLFGGGKDDQDKDVEKSRKILKKFD